VFNRRTMLAHAAAAALIVPRAGAAADGSSLEPPVASTNSGRVAGRRVDGICMFKGIPYGASTAGSGRFEPPRAPEAWSGVLKTVDDPPQAPQHDPGKPRRPRSDSPYEGIEPDWTQVPESEDCLKLNVWTPGLEGGKRPVMVWFHGGGFAVGSAAGQWQDGGRLCRRGDVVVVSVNHRLNVLGYLYVDLLNAAFAGAGNAGLLDLVLALKWVQENIARFGGDPQNVTIFGQSGGGQKVSMLLAMPAASGLFQKAIVQSGPAPRALEPQYAADMARRLLAKLEIGTGEVERLQQVALDRIMSAYYSVFRETGGYGVLGILQGFAPVVDGKWLPQHPFDPEAPVVSADVPLMIGTTRTEMTLGALLEDPAADRMSESSLRDRLAGLFGNDTQRVLDAYRASHPGFSPWELYAVITSDWPTRLYSIWIAERKARLRRAPVFMYRTDWRTPVAEGKLMAPHAIDIGFVLDDTPYTRSFDGGGRGAAQMTRSMSGAWLEFARHGNPNNGSLPRWPAYEPERRSTLLFDTPCRVVDDPDGADRRILDNLLAKR